MNKNGQIQLNLKSYAPQNIKEIPSQPLHLKSPFFRGVVDVLAKSIIFKNSCV
jgi:hypothetical protein